MKEATAAGRQQTAPFNLISSTLSFLFKRNEKLNEIEDWFGESSSGCNQRNQSINQSNFFWLNWFDLIYLNCFAAGAATTQQINQTKLNFFSFDWIDCWLWTAALLRRKERKDFSFLCWPPLREDKTNNLFFSSRIHLWECGEERLVLSSWIVLSFHLQAFLLCGGLFFLFLLSLAAPGGALSRRLLHWFHQFRNCWLLAVRHAAKKERSES